MKKRITRFWKIFSELFAGYRAKMSALSVFGLLSGFLDGISVSLLVPLFTVFLKGGDMGSNFAIKAISSALSYLNISFSFRALLIITFSAFIFKTVILFVSGYLRGRTIADYKVMLRRRFYKAFLSSDFSYLRKQKIGHLNSVIMGELKQSSKLFDDIVGLILAVGSSLMYLAVAFALSWQITILTVLLGAVLMFCLFPFLKKIRKESRVLVSLGKRISHAFAETLLGIKTVKALGVEKEVAASTNILFEEVERAEFRKYYIKMITKQLFEPVSVVFILAVFAISYSYLQFDLVSFIAIIYLINRVFGNINNIQSGAATILESIPSAEEIVSTINTIQKNSAPARGNMKFLLKREMTAENVSFSYDSANKALDGVSFRIQKGEIIGIIGPSGAGKTTLVDLLLGLLVPTSGNIAVDGINAQEISTDNWRKKVIYVAQEVFLRNDTITENVRFYDPSISDEDIVAACKQANIYDFIQTLPKGLKTIAGERGTRLSGGERQRIAIARALARKPEILILDEATSALDAESEREIKETLGSLHGNLTIIIIAHRLTTVADSDRIIALENGRIVEEGVPSELQKNPSSYYSRAMRAAIS